MKPLYDVNGAAQLLSVSPWTIRARIREGKLQAVHIGRRVLLEEEQLERLVREGRGSDETKKSVEILGDTQQGQGEPNDHE